MRHLPLCGYIHADVLHVLPTQTPHQQHEDYLLTIEGSARHYQYYLSNVLTTDASDDKLICDSNGALMKTEKAFL